MILKRIGKTLLVIGVGSFVLPLFGMQFRLLNLLFGDSQSIVGLIMAVLGLLLLGISIMTGKASTPPVSPAAHPTVKASPMALPTTLRGSPTSHCLQCGEVLMAGDRFCAECGRPATVASFSATRLCPRCGRAVPPSKSFCGRCGTRVA